MISKHKVKRKNGFKTQIRVVEGYRPSPGAAPKQRQIKNFGYLEDHLDDLDAFWSKVNACNDSLKASKEKITISLDALGDPHDTKLYNYGYRYLEAVYDFLELDKFFKKIKSGSSYDLGTIFKFLVLERILNPDSKRATAQHIGSLYMMDSEFSLDNIYRALTKIAECMDDMQVHLNSIIEKKIGRNKEYAFYDTTNYYFTRDFPISDDALGQKGVSKEHQITPIVQLGLFMDDNKIPMRMELYKGNTADTLTLQPSIELIKDEYDLGRLIVVADKGMNSGKNLAYLKDRSDGYVVSQILKGKKGKRYHEIMKDENGYIVNEDGSYKYKQFTETITVKNNDGKKVELEQNVLIYWRKAIAERDKRKREVKIEKAKKSMTNNAYSLTHDSTEYLEVNHVEEVTGAVAKKKVVKINETKIQEEEQFDGFFCIITSEMDYDHLKIHEVYAQLEKIEESFKITKSNLDARPIYLSTNEHIKAHFQICFVALMIIRLIQFKMKDEISAERLQRALNACTCEEISKGIIHLTMTPGKRSYMNIYGKESAKILDETEEAVEDFKKIQRAYGVENKYINMKQELFNKHLKSIKYTITK